MSSTAPFAPAYAPVRVLMLIVTEECNLRCDYCFVDKKPRHMTAGTMRKAIDFFIDRQVSGALQDIHLSFFGGEPLLRLDLVEEAVAYARKPRRNVYKKVRFSVTTNGTVASPRVERLVRGAAMSVLVSTDGGPAAASYRPFLSGRSSYALVARNLPRFTRWTSDVCVRQSFHPGALDLAGNVCHLMALGAPWIVLAPIEDAPWEEHRTRLDAAYGELADLFVAQARAGRLLPLELTTRFLREHHAARRGAGRPARPCWAGASLIGVDVDGHVLPCHRFLYQPQHRLGRVEEPRMDDARWRWVHLSADDVLGCEGCEARTVCGGGCRSVAVASGHGPYGRHPGYCLTMRAHFRAVRRIYETLTAEGNETLARMLASGGRSSGMTLGELATR